MEKILSFLGGVMLLVAALPASNSYKLNNYGFGNGGTGSSSSTTYSVNGIAGEQSGLQVNSATKAAQTGNNYTQNAQVPTLTFTNGNNYYRKLPLIINVNGNASDALFAVAISTDNFGSTNYVKSDNTIGASLIYPTDYRTYAGWGSGSGVFVIGLSINTTYYVKAKAIQGKFSETAYGPVVSAATVAPTLSFSLTPSSINIGTLTAGSVITSGTAAQVTYTTNADSGSDIYASSLNAGLVSAAAANYKINAVTGQVDLSLGATPEGYGARGSSVSQSSGGPLAIDSPFNGAGSVVGGFTNLFQPIFSSPGPITSGIGSLVLAAKSKTITPSASDYSDTVTMIAAGKF